VIEDEDLQVLRAVVALWLVDAQADPMGVSVTEAGRLAGFVLYGDDADEAVDALVEEGLVVVDYTKTRNSVSKAELHVRPTPKGVMAAIS
jgi:hypothetical protein